MPTKRGLVQLIRATAKRLLLRPAPHALLSIRYLLPRQGPLVESHRQVLLQAWPQLRRWQWLLIAIYSFTLWYLFFAWLSIARTWLKSSGPLRQQHGISRFHQCLQLFQLCFLHSIAAPAYYYFRLYRHPASDWLNFVFHQELPYWHLLASPNIKPDTLKLLQDKQRFADFLAELGIASVPTIDLLEATELCDATIFRKQSLFFKPRSGSAKRGCVALSYESETYRADFAAGHVEGEANCAAVLGAVVTEPYLVQALLKPHPDVFTWLGIKAAALPMPILRLVTQRDDRGDIITLSAVLEIHLSASGQGQRPLPLNVSSGKLRADAVSLSCQKPISTKLHGETLTIQAADLEGQALDNPLPFWSLAEDYCHRAHRSLTDVNSIAWDVALSDQGVKILEGNFNWGTSYWHQPRWQPLGNGRAK